MNNFFAKNIKYLRIKHNMDRQDLAEKLDVGLSTISCWENELRTPNLDMLAKIIELFNIKVDIVTQDLEQLNNYEIHHIYKDKDNEVSVLLHPDIDKLPDEVKADILRQAMEEKQNLILEETEQLFNIKKELDSIEKKD